MSLESDVRYLLDRLEIQDVIARYGLGQDVHQPHDENLDVLAHWADVFAQDAVLDYSEAGMPAAMSREDLADLMRGPHRDGGMANIYTVWQHVEGHATVTIDGTGPPPFHRTCTLTRQSLASRPTSSPQACSTTPWSGAPRAGGSCTDDSRTSTCTP
ncbi:nuclear transport factor 2 family protein [Amycolatopsis sp. EV170708-02-1]|uniref:nuclear transport factor 2 family protein n=1 Tax=Amycolatopsis sp. EV170708-02-1 TaxID=2919322 RepID=UPI0037C02521